MNNGPNQIQQEGRRKEKMKRRIEAHVVASSLRSFVGHDSPILHEFLLTCLIIRLTLRQLAHVPPAAKRLDELDTGVHATPYQIDFGALIG